MRDGAPGSSERVQRRGVWGVSGDPRCRVGKTDSDLSRHCYGDPGVSGQGRRLECGPRRKLAGLLCRWQFGRGLSSKLSIYDLSGDGLSIKADTEDQFIGGVHLGYNLQGAHILYGIEGDADFSQDISFLGSIRGRLGWAGERVMVYGTAGVGFVNADANFTISSNPPTKLSHEISEVAFVVGGGLDFKVLPRLSLGAEGLFYDFANDEA
jgi:opacity protein-like surface antigen